TQLTRGAPILVERVRLPGQDVSIEGSFEPPALARLSGEDQVFVAAFVRCHGSIKQMEKYFGVSYPTIKNRLNRIGEALSFVEIGREEAPPASDVLKRLEDGTITVAQALEELNAAKRAT
ncbi:MAG TPA: DUF2089 domain-containing protein, partial [Thermoanaerobaculia bacterium]|nr:DUF2089 domain-containing protein [Thermoanaerobaculia bacterium]